MRTARLDHDAMGGTAPVPMGSSASQPFYLSTGRTRHPAQEPTSDMAPMPINVDWRLVLARLGMTDAAVGAATGRERTTVRKWHSGQCMPPIDAQRELARLWESRVGGPLPGQRSPGSTAGAIPAAHPRKGGRPSKAEVAARTPAPITADELLRKTPVHRVAPPTRVIDHMAASDEPQPPKPAPKIAKVPRVEKAEKVGKPDGRRRQRPTPAVMAAQGRAIAKAREALGLTQLGAAMRLHIAASTFGNYETGTAPIPPERHAALAAALGMPADWHMVPA